MKRKKMQNKYNNAEFSSCFFLILFCWVLLNNISSKIHYIKSLIRLNSLKSIRFLSRLARRIIMIAGITNVTKNKRVPSETLIKHIINCLFVHTGDTSFGNT